jgi:hypothetical protein
MPAFPKDNKLFTAIFLVLLSAHLILVASTRLFPFTDLPDHLAAATIARHIGEPSNQFSEYYTVEAFGKPNTFHLIFCSLRIFPSVEFANRVFFLLCVALVPLATLWVITKLGGNRWFSLLSFLLVYNLNVNWGFVGFAFAIPLVLAFYCLFILDTHALESISSVSFAAAFLVLLFFVHLLAALFCILLLCLRLAIGGATSRRAVFGSMLVLVPFLVIISLWWRGEPRDHAAPGTLAFLSSYYRDLYLETFAHRRGIFVFDNCHLYEGARGYAIALAFSAAIIIPAGAFLLKRPRASSRVGMQRPADTGTGMTPLAPALPLFLGSLLCSLILPNEIPQQAVLYERFSVFLLLSIVICGSALAPRPLPRLAPSVFAALAVFHFALWSDYFISFNRENAGFNKSFLAPAESDKKLAGLVYDYRYRGRPTYIHFPSYYIVWEKSIATAMITDYRFGPVRRNVNRPGLPRYLEWVARIGDYDGRYRDMDYLLVRGTASIPARYLKGFGAMRVSGTWALYERIPLRPRAGDARKTIDNGQ